MKDLARRGDLLFYKVTPVSGWWARLIAIGQLWFKEGKKETQYSHVSIIIGNGDLQVEAVWPRVCISEIDWTCDRLELCEIDGITDDERYGIAAHAINSVGRYYDIGNFLFGLFDFKHAEICTTLVRSAAAAVGIQLGGEFGRLLTPNELREDERIRRK